MGAERTGVQLSVRLRGTIPKRKLEPTIGFANAMRKRRFASPRTDDLLNPKWHRP